MKLYKFRKLRQECQSDLDRLKDILVNERLYCASYDSLNDPFEGILGYIPNVQKSDAKNINVEYLRNLSCEWRYHKDKLSKNRICSLSASSDDILMWSHYAAGNQGVCIELDIPEDNQFLHEVTYVNSMDELPCDDNPYYLTKKLDCWHYEDEWRIIQKEEYFPVSGYITSVILGGKVDAAGIELVLSVIQERNFNYSVAVPTQQGKIKIK